MRQAFPVMATRSILALLMLAGLALCPSRGMAGADEVDHRDPIHGKKIVKLDDLRQALGVEVVSLRRSGAGHILDLRYRIVDREKAAPFVEGRIRPFVIDPDRKLLLQVPFAQKVGALRQQHLSARPDFVYFMLFGNIGRMVQAGDHVTVVFGNFRIDDVLVQG